MNAIQLRPTKPKLPNRMRDKIRLKHCSIRTEATYVDWTRRYMLFYDKCHPQDMGAAGVEAF